MVDKFIAHLRQSDKVAQPLMTHLQETSELAAAFAAKIGMEDHGRISGLLHDLGKASGEFDTYIRSAVGLIDPDEDEYIDAVGKKGKVDHSSAGAQIVHRLLSVQSGEGAIAAQFLALCIASHHSGMIDCLGPDGRDNYRRRMEKAEEKAHADEAFSNLAEIDRQTIENLINESLSEQLVMKIRSLKEECDSKDSLMFKAGLLARYLLSCLIDADRLNTADFENPRLSQIRNSGTYIAWDRLLERFNTKVFIGRNRIDDLRDAVSRQCYEASLKPKGLFQLTVPTGGGKTYSSLRFALNHAREHKMDRIVYVIPYTSIIDQNADSVRNILNDTDEIVLEHHTNLTPEEATIRQGILSENWDAPIVFTTSVQFLEALFRGGTRSVRRMHQLANAVIIFDEIQTIPIRCVHMFNVALRFLMVGCGSSAVLCTATQPLLDKIEPRSKSLEVSPDRKIIADTKELFQELKRVTIHDVRKTNGWQDADIAELVHQELERLKVVQGNPSVLIIVNTKASARDLFSRLRGTGSAEVYHLSTDMCAQHRLDVLEIIRKRLEQNLPTLCVSTQLIEAGVDIDFGSVVRYLAGLDSIAQAAGRCNRHGLRSPGNVYIINPANERLGALDEIKVGAEITLRILDEFKENPSRFDEDLLTPTAIDRYYEYYFYDRRDKMGYPVGAGSVVGRNDDLFSLLSTNPLSVLSYERTKGESSTLFLRQSFQTASRAFQPIDTQTRGIVVPYAEEGKAIITELCAAFEVDKQYKLQKRAQRYSINIFENVFHSSIEQGIIQEVQKGAGVYYLNDLYYSTDFGMSRESTGLMEPLMA